jgi:hypothetical protein
MDHLATQRLGELLDGGLGDSHTCGHSSPPEDFESDLEPKRERLAGQGVEGVRD